MAKVIAEVRGWQKKFNVSDNVLRHGRMDILSEYPIPKFESNEPAEVEVLTLYLSKEKYFGLPVFRFEG